MFDVLLKESRMLCPVCKTVTLANEDLQQNLTAKTCKQCGGRWLPSYQYWKWLDKHGATLPEKPIDAGLSLPVDDSPAGKVCPECGHFLSRKRVGHGIDFHLDRCNNCGGLWFDLNEWEVLLSRNLHDEVHFVFSSAWQKQVQRDDAKHVQAERLEKILGHEDYAKMIEIAGWIRSHPNKSTILSYLAEK